MGTVVMVLVQADLVASHRSILTMLRLNSVIASGADASTAAQPIHLLGEGRASTPAKWFVFHLSVETIFVVYFNFVSTEPVFFSSFLFLKIHSSFSLLNNQ